MIPKWVPVVLMIDAAILAVCVAVQILLLVHRYAGHSPL